ncbi:hypothetical protein [Desulfospira joergensenii]|uniref:hypothetical protein n=1 Tax=Desulfospira joergensenii TaxID=53329 RepID=UPI0003B4A3A3|nr:hypothetical protein [Desulfospira joergensenii]
MAKFKIDKKICSTKVDKQLIEDIEKYLTERLPLKLAGQIESDLDEKYDLSDFRYSLVLFDKFGKEEFETFKEFHRDKLPNDTKRLTFNLTSKYREFDLTLSFGKDRLYSEISIEINSKNARELANGIVHEINQLTEENKTIHHVFHGKWPWVLYVILLTSMSISTWSIFDNFKYQKETRLFILLTSLAFFIIKQFSPYSYFDTKLNSKRDSATKWLLNGLAGVFIFGVIAVYLRKLLIE